jgi:ATP-dependent RNA helicase RhlE
LIEVARRNTVVDTITHRLHMVGSDQKRHLLLHLLNASNLSQVLVFVGTKFGASRLSVWLERQGVNATAIHGDKSQQQRTEALEAFKAGTVRVLVATDVAARGLDIDDLPHVINYELPHTAEDYIHRIGRTGRAGKSGDATSLVAPEEKPRLADIERLIKFKIDQVPVPGFDPGAPSHSEEREHGRHGHTREREERRPRGPRASVALPHPASHVPVVATDGFDFSKPYESKTESGVTTSAEKPPRRPLKPVAALLGGFGKKP